MRRLLLAAILTSAALGVAQRAAAQAPPRRVPVAAVCLDQAEEDPVLPMLLCAHLEPWLQGSARWSPVSIDRVLAASSGQDPVVATLQARERLEEARGLLQAGSPQQALPRLQAATDELIALDPWLTDRALLADALLALADAQLRLPRERRHADATAARLLNFAPDAQARDAASGPLRDLLQRAAARREAGRGELRLTCDAPACEVYLDGALQGVTPLTLRDVPGGEHLVRMRRPGFTPTTRRATVAPRRPAAVHIDLPPAPGFTGYDRLRQDLPAEIGALRAGPAMRDLRSLLVADQLLALRVLPPDPEGVRTLELYLYDLRSEQLLAVADLPLPQGEPSLPGLIEQLTGGLLDAERRQIEAAAPPPGEEGAPSLWNRWWLWGGVGAALLFSGAAILYYTLDDDGAAAPPPAGDPDRGTIRLVF